MNMGKIILKAKFREKTGREISRKLRAQGLIPATLYGPSTHPIPLTINPSVVLKLLGKEGTASSFFDLEINDGQTSQKKKVLIKDVDFHPVTDQLMHVDFYEIARGKELTVNVPITLVGKAKGLEKGGILEQNKRTLTISCLPHLVPECIEIDVSKLDAGDSIHIKDISLKEGIRIIENPQIPVVTMVVTEAEKEEVEEKEEGEGKET